MITLYVPVYEVADDNPHRSSLVVLNEHRVPVTVREVIAVCTSRRTTARLLNDRGETKGAVLSDGSFSFV